MRVDLSDGQWLDLVPASELLDGDRKAVNRAITVEVTDDGRAIMPGDYEDLQRDAMLKRVVTNWSFSHLPIPSQDPASLDKLPIKMAKEVYAAIDEHMALIRTGSGPAERGSRPTNS
jgi:hypothetical protein